MGRFRSHERLEVGQKHILRLIARDRNSEGWAYVSEQLYGPIARDMPSELVEFRKVEVGGEVRLTEEGQKVIDVMDWF